MNVQATADALVGNPQEAQQPAEQTETTQEGVSEDDFLSDLFGEIEARGQEGEDGKAEGEAEPEKQEDPPEAEADQKAEPQELPEPEEKAEGEKKPEPVETPSGLPADLRKHWAEMPEAARNAVLADRDGLHRRLSDMGRQVQAISPIRDVLAEAVQKLPALSSMQPQQAAQEIMQLAVMAQDLTARPVETIMKVIQQHGVEQAVSQALSGKDVSSGAQAFAAMQSRINDLEKRLAQAADPDFVRQQVSQITEEQAMMQNVQSFAADAEHWNADIGGGQKLESVIPHYIPAVQRKLGQGAAPEAVLKLAYEKALEDYLPEAKASPEPATPAPAEMDPERTEAALKAKSIKVNSKSNGQKRVLTEDEELLQVWSKLNK